jgi:hypothetical protein
MFVDERTPKTAEKLRSRAMQVGWAEFAMTHWFRRTLFLALAVCGAGLVSGQGQTSKPEWKEYSYSDEGFAMKAPAQPTFAKQQQPTAAGNLEMRQYSVDLTKDSGVLMSVSDFPTANYAAPKQALETAVNGSIQATKANKTSEKDIEVQQVPGIEFEADTEAYHMLGRYYWKDKRLFSMLAISPLGAPVPADALRVLDSLKLMAFSPVRPPKPEWKEYSYANDGFSMTTPSQPGLEKQQQATTSGNIEMRQYSVDLTGNVEVLMSVSDFPNTNHATPKEALEAAVNGSIQSAKAKKASEKDIELQQVPGIEFEADTEAYHMVGRYYWRDNRLFSLLAVAPLGAPMPADAMRVLDSLKFVAK